MHRTPAFRYIVVIFAICLACAALTSRATSSPNLDHASDALTAAQKVVDGGASGDPNDPMVVSASPLTPQQVDDATAKLQEALKWLNRATNDKGGKRDDVKTIVNDAIQALKSGDKAGADKAIRQAKDGIFSAATHRGGW